MNACVVMCVCMRMHVLGLMCVCVQKRVHVLVCVCVCVIAFLAETIRFCVSVTAVMSIIKSSFELFSACFTAVQFFLKYRHYSPIHTKPL